MSGGADESKLRNCAPDVSPSPFRDPPNTATFTNSCIVNGLHPIRLVTHDAEDGAWQFLCGDPGEASDVRVVGLGSIIQLDASIGELADLPLGWRAWRSAHGEPWRWAKNPRLLTEEEFRATFRERMLDITGREDDVYPDGVIDIEPYVEAIADSDLKGVGLIPGAPPTNVYLAGDGRYTHVLYRCNRSNVYLVVVVSMKPDDVYGHYVLDLGKEYGLDSAVS